MKLAWAGMLIGVAGLIVMTAGCGDDRGHRMNSDNDRGPGPGVYRDGPDRDDGPIVVVEDRPREVIVVREAPPPRRKEVRPPPPDREHVWIGGYYDYQSDRRAYVWVPGHYDKPPRKGARWVEDKWDKDKDGYRHNPGHWN
jgi:hypothetical protein